MTIDATTSDFRAALQQVAAEPATAPVAQYIEDLRIELGFAHLDRAKLRAQLTTQEQAVQERGIENAQLRAEVKRLDSLCASVGAAHDKAMMEFRTVAARAERAEAYIVAIHGKEVLREVLARAVKAAPP